MKLVDYFNNRETDVEIEELGPAGTGYNSPMKVRVNGVLGFKKKSVNEQVFDLFEYLITQLGKMIGIKTAHTFFFDDGSIFSQSVYGEGEEFITWRDIANEINVSESEVEEKISFDSSLKQEVIKGKTMSYAETPSQIDFAVSVFIRIIKKMKLSNENEIIRDYIRMCFLDSLTGNKDRVDGNYGLIKKGNEFSFAPLFDSSTISYTGIEENYVQLNNYLIDRDNLYDYLLSKYPNYLSDIFDVDKDKVIGKLKALEDSVFAENNEAREWFDRAVTDRLPQKLNKYNIFFPKEEKKEQSVDYKQYQ